MHAILAVAYAALFAAMFYRASWFRIANLPAVTVPLLFVIKIGAGLVLWYIYTYHYTYRDTSDAFRYFDDAMVIRGLWNEDRELFWKFFFGYGLHGEDASHVLEQLKTWNAGYRYGLNYDGPTIVRINLLISVFSFGYYHVHTVFMCAMSTVGLTAVVHAFKRMFKDRMIWLLAAVFLLPSVCFWSSGVLKEAPLMLALGLFVWSMFSLFTDPRQPWLWVLVATCVGLLFHLKEYVIISMIPGTLFLVLCALTGKRLMLIKFISVHVLAFLIAMYAPVNSGGNLIYILGKKQQDFINVGQMAGAGSMIDPVPVADIPAFLKNYPRALGNTFLRPHIFESDGPFYLAAALENALLVLLIFLIPFRFRRPEKEDQIPLLWCLSFILVIGGIIGFTVPILGALVRYKIAALPFLFILVTTFIRPFHPGSGEWK